MHEFGQIDERRENFVPDMVIRRLQGREFLAKNPKNDTEKANLLQTRTGCIAELEPLI